MFLTIFGLQNFNLIFFVFNVNCFTLTFINESDGPLRHEKSSEWSVMEQPYRGNNV